LTVTVKSPSTGWSTRGAFEEMDGLRSWFVPGTVIVSFPPAACTVQSPSGSVT
jgi:hypothetical protein